MIRNRKAALSIIFIFFILSVFIRLPNLNRPLSDHQEFNTATVLVCIESWMQAGGAKNFHFVQVINYQNPGDKVYNSPKSDENGNVMYITFGPGWCVLPYMFVKIFSISSTPLFIETFNLLLQLASCLILFAIVSLLFKGEYEENYFPHIIACIVFMLNPALLWVMGNAYSPGSAALPFELLLIFYFTRMALDENKITYKNIIISFLAVFAIIYCDWVGVFIACLFGFTFFLFAKKNKKYLLPSLFYFVSIVFAFIILFTQYAVHAEAAKTAEILFYRFLYRTYGNDGHGVSFIIKWALDIFFTRLLPILLLLAFCFIVQKNKRTILAFDRSKIRYLLISIFVLVVHNSIFLGWTAANDFSIMNYSIPFSILSGILVYELFSWKQRFVVLSAFIALCIAEYYYFNRPGDFDRKGQSYSRYKDFGEEIKKIAQPDEVIFTNAEPAPQGWYYAKRNYFMVNSFDEAVSEFKNWKQKKAIYISQHDSHIDWHKRITK